MKKEKIDIYSRLGVSSKKEDVHKAIENKDKGLFPGAFCKIVEDVAGRSDYCSIFHEDGAGTKSSLAYMYYKEIGDLSIFKGVVRDAIIMNLDDIICVGSTDSILLSNTIARNAYFIDGYILNEIIDEYYSYCRELSSYGLNIILSGGETEDMGDIVKTLSVFASVFTTMKRENVINANNISSNDIIIGLASSGKATYEKEYNSGIGSNGLTLARHGVLSHEYYDKYPECYDNKIEESMVFYGKHKLTDIIDEKNTTIGKALLSPTRTYAPVLLKTLDKYRNKINGIIHNTGGGQTKCMNFGNNIKYIKNDLFPLPKIFEIIQKSSKATWEEMYRVFNMGHRMELYCDKSISKNIINIAKKFNIDAKIIGYCEKSPLKNKNSLEIKSEFGNFSYN
ncbi:MAG: phosphoribosylformylglycinamidine cyclo-ligase [Candidatus Lokiarchaeota archaeon]|nr:phosphoribosylformylglycinamidine cyclo-ligase [Candidatus Lokiarchaeota archaeon]